MQQIKAYFGILATVKSSTKAKKIILEVDGISTNTMADFLKFVPFPMLNFLCSKATHTSKKKQGQK